MYARLRLLLLWTSAALRAHRRAEVAYESAHPQPDPASRRRRARHTAMQGRRPRSGPGHADRWRLAVKLRPAEHSLISGGCCTLDGAPPRTAEPGGHQAGARLSRSLRTSFPIFPGRMYATLGAISRHGDEGAVVRNRHHAQTRLPHSAAGSNHGIEQGRSPVDQEMFDPEVTCETVCGQPARSSGVPGEFLW
jgi:hypothetical protein